MDGRWVVDTGWMERWMDDGWMGGDWRILDGWYWMDGWWVDGGYWMDGRGVWGRVDTCIGMAESLQCSPERNTTLQQSIFQYIIKNLNT